jgi:hypothetical protein
MPSLVGIGGAQQRRRRRHDRERGRRPHAGLQGAATGRRGRAIVEYVVSGASVTVDAAKPTPFDMRYSMDGYTRFTDPDGFPAIKPPGGRSLRST